MDTHLVPTAMREFERLIGFETPLDHFHGALRRAAQSVQPVRGYGMVQVTCSDEFQGEIRASFERNVARPLMSGAIDGHRTTFALANMGGRLEAGALALAQNHFQAGDPRAPARLLVVEITAHVGLRQTSTGKQWGYVERFGTTSECCGALSTLIANTTTTAAVRHPWFDQLSRFFGPDRLGVLRADASPTRMLTAAIVHAVLQAESAVTDLLREPPSTATHVLVAPLVVINQTGLEQTIPVGVHHLLSDGREIAVLHGKSLRSTPAALRFGSDAGRLHVTSDEGLESTGERRAIVAHPHFAEQLRAVHAADDEKSREKARLVQQALKRTEVHVDRMRKHPQAWRAYARPMLRGLIQGLSVVAPEVGVAALLFEVGRDAAHAQHLKRLLERGPSSEEARKVLHDLEADIQQLGHREAQDVLEILMQESKVLIAGAKG